MRELPGSHHKKPTLVGFRGILGKKRVRIELGGLSGLWWGGHPHSWGLDRRAPPGLCSPLPLPAPAFPRPPFPLEPCCSQGLSLALAPVLTLPEGLCPFVTQEAASSVQPLPTNTRPRFPTSSWTPPALTHMVCRDGENCPGKREQKVRSSAEASRAEAELAVPPLPVFLSPRKSSVI